MRRALHLVAALLFACAAVPTAAAARGFSLGVSSAEVTPSSALVWTRADKTGPVTVEVATDRGFRHVVARRRLSATNANDNTVQTKVTGLPSGQRLYYRFAVSSARSDIGSLKTAPASSSAGAVDFAWSGDVDPVRDPGTHKLFFAPFRVYSRMAKAGNDFNINLGDTIYSDTDSNLENVDPLALTVDQKRTKYRDVLSDPNVRKARAAASFYNQWDDHEFLNDFAIGQTDYPTAFGTQPGDPPKHITVDGRQLYQAGVTAFREYMPVSYSPARGTYRDFRWGKSLEIFIPDERSFRDVGADDGPVCDNPAGSGNRDLAPTAPQRIRNVFAVLVPAFSNPPPPGCVDRINDPSRTFLGAGQFARLTAAVKRSKATWKVVVSEMPIQQLYADPYDRWEGYAAERARLLTFLRDSVKNVVFLATDVHADYVNDARFTTFPEEGGPQDSGITEFVTGPIGTDSAVKDLNDETHNPQAGQLANSAFFSRPPPDGPGIKCSNGDVRSYGQVHVTGSTFTVRLLDERGKPVKGADGKPCGPYTLKRK